MGRKALKAIQKELPSVPTSYRVLIKGSVVNDNSKEPGDPKFSGKGSRQIWRLCRFRNPARSDGLVLRHWRHLEKDAESLSVDENISKVKRFKTSANLDCDVTFTLPVTEEEKTVFDAYPFARVNPSVKIYRYSDEFYRFHLADLDPTWTKDETDLLFDLCEMFELRFIAIHDRFKWRKDITLEKLKQRYYSVTKRIVEFSFEEKIKNEISKHNNPNHPAVLALKDESFRHPLVKFVYNAEHDKDRRHMLERSYKISPQQRELEARLLQDIKQAEYQYKIEEKKRGDMRKLKRKFHLNETEVIPSPKMDELCSKNVWLSSSFVNFYKSQLSQKHNDAVDEMLSALNIPPPIVSSRDSNELYCMVRGDAAIMINVVNKVESLKKELEHWQDLVARTPEGLVSSGPLVNFKVKEERLSDVLESGESIPLYGCPRPLMGAKGFLKPKQGQMQAIPQVNLEEGDDGGVRAFSGMPLEIQGSQAQPQPLPIPLFQGSGFAHMAHCQRFMMPNIQQQRPPGLQPVYAVKANTGGGSNPQPFPQHVYAHFPQQMAQQQLMAQHRLVHQQPFQQQYPQNGFRQQPFQPVPMCVHPPGVYFPQGQIYSQNAQGAHFGHVMQHPHPMVGSQHQLGGSQERQA